MRVLLECCWALRRQDTVTVLWRFVATTAKTLTLATAAGLLLILPYLMVLVSLEMRINLLIKEEQRRTVRWTQAVVNPVPAPLGFGQAVAGRGYPKLPQNNEAFSLAPYSLFGDGCHHQHISVDGHHEAFC